MSGAAPQPLSPAAWRDLALVMVTSTMAGATMALSSPLISLVLADAGYSELVIGANAAVHGLGIFLVAPFVQPLLRRLGAAGCMRASLLVAALVMLALPLRLDLASWFLLRLVLGAASALLFVVSESAVNGLAPAASRGRIIGLYATLFSLGYATGPLIVALVGHEGPLPFAIGALIFFLGMIPAGRARAADRVLGQRGEVKAKPARQRLAGLAALAARAPFPFATILAFGIIEAACFALLPIWGLAEGQNESAAAFQLTVWIAGNLLLQVPLGWLADRLGPVPVTAATLLATITGLLLLPLTVATPWLLWPLLALIGGVMGGLYALSLMQIGRSFTGFELAAANTAFLMLFELGAFIGPALSGGAMQLLGSWSLPPSLIPPLLLPFLVLLLRFRASPPSTA